MEKMKKCIWNFLCWSFVIFFGLLIWGLINQDIRQSSELMKWLLFRHWYPYFQAATLSILLTTSALVLSGFIKEIAAIDNAPLYLKILDKIGKALNTICPDQKNNIAWRILWGISIMLFILSMLIPKCVTSDQILISFDIWDDNKLIADVFSGETVLVEQGNYIDIETKLETGLLNLPLSQITCAWTYMGDGSIKSITQCKTNYETGRDDTIDTVSVKLSQPFCPSLGFHTFILKKSP